MTSTSTATRDSVPHSAAAPAPPSSLPAIGQQNLNDIYSLRNRRSMFLPRFDPEQQQQQQQGRSLRRAQSRYFDPGDATNNDLDGLGNGLNGLRISTTPQAIYHQPSQLFEQYDSRGDSLRYDSLLSRAPQPLYHQLSSEYGWKQGQAQAQQPWMDTLQSQPQDFMPPRMPFLASQAYSTSPSSGYSPSKSETMSDSATAYSSSPQNRLQARMSYMSTSSQPQLAEQDDELIPTAIVIKNIPFAIKKEELMELILSLGLTLPYAFNYHFDNGVFRGLAFANFATSEDTAAVIDALNGHEISGRRLRVEYKKMLPAADRERIEREKRGKRGQLEEQHRASHAQLPKATPASAAASAVANNGSSPPPNARMELDLNDRDTLNFYSEILLFRDDLTRDELVFGGPLNPLHPLQRRNVHLLAHIMGLQHVSRGEGDARQVVVSRRPPQMPMYARDNLDFASSGDSRLRGTKSFADIRSTARLGNLYASPSSGNMAAPLYGNQSLRAP